MNFKTMGVAFDNKKLAQPANDEIIAEILSPEGIVEIQGKIFKLDYDNRIVYVYETEKDFSANICTKEYSFDDEVLTLEFSDNQFTLDDKISYAPSWNPNYVWFYDVNGVDVKFKIAYLKEGIYFTLVSKIEKSSLGNPEIRTDASGFYSRKNETKSFNGTTGTQTDFNAKYRPYAGTKRLYHYSIDASFFARGYQTNPYDFRAIQWAHSY